MLKLRLNPYVKTDLDEIRDYISEDNAEAADKLINQFYEKFELLVSLPDIGANLSNRVSFDTDYKYLIVNNYIIIYKYNKEFVEVYRIINRYRDITKLFDNN